jgi:hypothetical protein
VRLGRYVLAEAVILSGFLAGGTLATWGGVSLGRKLHGGRGTGAQAQAFLPRADTPSPPSPAIVEEASGTFLGMSDEMLLERVRGQPIVRMKLNRGGSSLSFRVDLADGTRAAFKPAQTNLQTIPRKEVAAYRLNRLLGLNAVPPAATRMVSRDEILDRLHPDSGYAVPRIRAETVFNPAGLTAGVFMYWVPEIKDSGLDTPEGIQASMQWLTQGQPIPPDKRSLAAQLSQIILFDFLTNNPDRYSGGNLLTIPDGTRLLFMDNTMSFFIDPEGNEQPRAWLQRTQRFSRQMVQALDRITLPALQRIVSRGPRDDFEILTPAEIRAVVARRAFARRHIDGLIATYGQGNVLAFP